MNTHEVTVLNGTIDVSWRRNKGNIFYVAEETETGIIILTPAAQIPARRKQGIPLKTDPLTLDEIQEHWRSQGETSHGNENPETQKTPHVHPLP